MVWLVLRDFLPRRRVVFLVAEHYMVEQRTVRRQELNSDFESFAVPEFRFFQLLVEIELLKEREFFFKLD